MRRELCVVDAGSHPASIYDVLLPFLKLPRRNQKMSTVASPELSETVAPIVCGGSTPADERLAVAVHAVARQVNVKVVAV